MKQRINSLLKAITPPLVKEIHNVLIRSLGKSTISGTYRLSSGEKYYSGKAVGGQWNKIGKLQFDYLVDSGLKPYHKLLDIGCGSLRGGVHFIQYLNDGNYHGIEKEQWLLNAAAEVELPRYGLNNATVHLIRRDDFDFSIFGVEFDYALAQSVFTHLSWNSILKCLVSVKPVLKRGGMFFATFFEDRHGEYRIKPMVHNPSGVKTYPDKDPFHYEFDVFEELSIRAGLRVEYLGDWNHPRNQMMMVFSK